MIVEDSWRLLEPGPWLRVGEDGLVPDFPERADLIVPMDLWRLRRDELLGREGRLGLVLDAWEEPQAFADALPHVQLLAIRIALFTDGRAYSLARLLRVRYAFTGELRAVGDVLRDQLLYLSRCGFDAFVLRKETERTPEVLKAFDELSAYPLRYPASEQHMDRQARRAGVLAGGSLHAAPARPRA